MRGEVQFCSFCGEELVRFEEVDDMDSSLTRVTLRCPKKKRSDYSFLSLFLKDYHTEKFDSYIDTVLNYDPITGERIKRDAKRVS